MDCMVERRRFEPAVPRGLRAFQKCPEVASILKLLDCRHLSGEDCRLLFGRMSIELTGDKACDVAERGQLTHRKRSGGFLNRGTRSHLCMTGDSRLVQ